jgi:hypothetical protein
MPNAQLSDQMDAFLTESTLSSTQQEALRTDLDAAKASVVNDYIGRDSLTAGSISYDVGVNGVVAKIDDLSSNTTMTLSNMADLDTVTVYITQNASTQSTFGFAHSGLTVEGVTTAIADLAVGERGIAYATKYGTELWVSAHDLPTS